MTKAAEKKEYRDNNIHCKAKKLHPVCIIGVMGILIALTQNNCICYIIMYVILGQTILLHIIFKFSFEQDPYFI